MHSHIIRCMIMLIYVIKNKHFMQFNHENYIQLRFIPSCMTSFNLCYGGFLYQYEVPLCVCLFGSIHRSFTWLFEVVVCVCVWIGTDPGGARLPLDSKFLIFLVIVYFIFVVGSISKPYAPFSPISLTNLTQIATI